MSDCMVVRSSRIGSVKDNLSCSMEGRTSTENQENLAIFTRICQLMIRGESESGVSNTSTNTNTYNSESNMSLGQKTQKR